MFVLENERQSRGKQQSQWFRSITNINLYKVILKHFSLALTVF